MLTPDDNIEEVKVRTYELLRAAIAEATRNGIKANSIVINKNMVRVPESFGQWPEMICGLHCFFTADELPNGYAFSIQHAPDRSAPVPAWIPVTERVPERWAILDPDGDPELLEFVVMIDGAEIPTVLRFDGSVFFDDRDGQIYDVTHWMPLPAPPVQEANQENTACEWCEPGREVCGTCERFFSGLATGCATESTDEKCAVYVPADHCMKCGRNLRSPAGNDQKG